MSFLSEDTIKSLEGKYLKWTNGDERTLKLLSIKPRVIKGFDGQPKEVQEVTCIDKATGEEKTFTANRSFLSALAKVNGLLEETGSIIKVLPTGRMVQFDDAEREVFDFTITVVE